MSKYLKFMGLAMMLIFPFTSTPPVHFKESLIFIHESLPWFSVTNQSYLMSLFEFKGLMKGTKRSASPGHLSSLSAKISVLLVLLFQCGIYTI